jgi:predicted PurR-regulated permease PerM
MSEPFQNPLPCPSPTEKRHRPFLLVVVFFSLYLTLLILRPFAHTIIFAIILASLFHPLHSRLALWSGGRRSLAA